MNTETEHKNGFVVRLLDEKEIATALELVRKVFMEYESPVYSEEGTEEFRNCLCDEKYLNGIKYYGAFSTDELIGVLGMRDATRHICFFFVDGKYQRRGVGRMLFSHMKADYTGKTITLNSSPYGLPFYKALGFSESGSEQTVNGIRFTPMILKGDVLEYRIVKLSERRDLKERAAEWYSAKWSVPKEVYLESIEESFKSDIPQWYICLDDDKIISGMGVIENDFHDRKDLTPNVCAVYTEQWYRRQGIAGRLLNYVCEDMAEKGIDILYLLTDLTGFYERYGWEYLCPVTGDGEEKPSRMYIHRRK